MLSAPGFVTPFSGPSKYFRIEPPQSDIKTSHRRQSVFTQKSELEGLETRLRLTEEKLKHQQQTGSLPSISDGQSISPPKSRSDLEPALIPPNHPSARSAHEDTQPSSNGDGRRTGVRRNGRSPLSPALIDHHQRQQQHTQCPPDGSFTSKTINPRMRDPTRSTSSPSHPPSAAPQKPQSLATASPVSSLAPENVTT